LATPSVEKQHLFLNEEALATSSTLAQKRLAYRPRHPSLVSTMLEVGA